jgi:hypothetical protein
MMNAFAVLVGIVLAGIAVQAAVSLYQTGRLEPSRFWYLALGLVLMPLLAEVSASGLCSRSLEDASISVTACYP